MNILIYRNYLIIPIIIVLGGGAVFFRDDISRLLQFEEDGVKVVSPGIPAEAPEKNGVPDAGVYVPVPEKPRGNSNTPAIPSYTGRDPAEIRPIPEEVKLFTEDQKTRLYARLDELGRAVKADPSFFKGWIDLGLFKKTIGDFEGARDAWEYAGVIQPLNSISFSNLGELYWRYLHLYPESEKNFETAIRHKPDDIQNYVSLAELYHYSFTEKFDEADDVLLRGLSLNPGDDWLTRRLAYLYEQRGEIVKAIEWWEKVLAQNPEDEGVKQRIEKLKDK